MIKRKLTEELISLLQYFPVVGILGPRQVGKTTLAKMLVAELKKEVVYLDLELPADIKKLEDPELYLQQHSDKCVMLDEIQRMPHLFPILRALIDQDRHPGRFVLLGSASPDLIRDSSESLAGRIAYKELHPLSLLEINHANYRGAEWRAHWFRGGFPEAWLAPDDKTTQTWLRYFVQNYIERDLPLLGLPADTTNTRKLWDMLAHFHGQIWNATAFAKALGMSQATVNKYLNFLSEAFMVRLLPAFSPNLKKRLVKSPKVYIRDSGILHYLTGIKTRESLQGNVLIGASWEGYVIEQIRQILDDDLQLYFYRTHSQSELDLVIARGSKPLAGIEIKYSSSPSLSRGGHTAIQDLETPLNYLITPQSEEYFMKEKVRVCSLPDFLQKHLPEIEG